MFGDHKRFIDLESRLTKLKTSAYGIDEKALAGALQFLIENGQLKISVPAPSVNFEIESNDVEKISESILFLQKKFGDSFKFNITAKVKV